MDKMTDSRAVEVLESIQLGVEMDRHCLDDGQDRLDALSHAIARLREPAGVGGVAVFNCPTCPVSVQGPWRAQDCPECGGPCEIAASAKPAAPQPPATEPSSGDKRLVSPVKPPAEAQAQPVAWARWHAEHGFRWRPIEQEARSPDMQGYVSVPLYTAPPSAPVGVEGLVLAARNAELAIRNYAAAGQIGDGYVQYADDLRDAVQRLAQQPAAVDGAYPTPRNRAEAVALARLALAYLGVIDAHIDAAIARCETIAAQPGGSDNDR